MAAFLETEEELRAIVGEATATVLHKLSDRLHPTTESWIRKSPFVCLASADAAGHCDVSPRGDAPGFVRILSETTLLIPERPGNRIADTLRNILATSRVGLLFVVPGVSETLRVNGRARLTADAALLAPSAVDGKAPKLGIFVEIEEVYTQCSKAFIRSDFWDPSRFLPREALPSNGEVHKELAARRGESFDAAGYDEERAARYARREGFW